MSHTLDAIAKRFKHPNLPPPCLPGLPLGSPRRHSSPPRHISPPPPFSPRRRASLPRHRSSKHPPSRLPPNRTNRRGRTTPRAPGTRRLRRGLPPRPGRPSVNEILTEPRLRLPRFKGINPPPPTRAYRVGASLEFSCSCRVPPVSSV